MTQPTGFFTKKRKRPRKLIYLPQMRRNVCHAPHAHHVRRGVDIKRRDYCIETSQIVLLQ
jgi:hypothetical protein